MRSGITTPLSFPRTRIPTWCTWCIVGLADLFCRWREGPSQGELDIVGSRQVRRQTGGGTGAVSVVVYRDLRKDNELFSSPPRRFGASTPPRRTGAEDRSTPFTCSGILLYRPSAGRAFRDIHLIVFWSGSLCTLAVTWFSRSRYPLRCPSLSSCHSLHRFGHLGCPRKHID